MKRLFVSLFCVMCVFNARADNDNTATSESYVDSVVAPLQDEIPAVNVNTVLTNTGESGEIGQKQIYDANADYALQQNALVTAETFNAAVQNAIDNEFVCIESIPEGCLLYQIRPVYHKSKNLFDESQLLQAYTWVENNGIYTGNVHRLYVEFGRPKGGFVIRDGFEPNTQYTLSYTMSGTGDDNMTNSYLGFLYDDGSVLQPLKEMVSVGEIKHVELTSRSGKSVAGVYVTYGIPGQISISDIQLEQGATATPYIPYGNTYMPVGQQ